MILVGRFRTFHDYSNDYYQNSAVKQTQNVLFIYTTSFFNIFIIIIQREIRENNLKMNQSNLSLTQNIQRMSFPPQIDMNYNLFPYQDFSTINNNNHYNTQVKYQNTNYNQSDFQQKKKKSQYNYKQQSPQYDLFEIQKKRKKQKYKRSTNNSHKKFISAIRRLFYAVISTKQKEQFQAKYSKYRSCRTFFFIILAYMRYRFSDKLLNSVRISFINQMKIKINEYQEEILRTKNVNLKNFREEQIIDIKYSIKSCNEYFNGNTREAIQCMYKKDKSTVIKRQHYESALKSVHVIEKQLMNDQKELLQEPYVQEYSANSDKEKIERKVIKRQIRETQNAKFALEKEENYDFGPSYPKSQININKKFMKNTADSDNQSEELNQQNGQNALQKEFLYPPMLQSIPYIKYDPFNPPFRYKKQTKMPLDLKQDFFGYMNYGFARFYQKQLDVMGINPLYPNFSTGITGMFNY